MAQGNELSIGMQVAIMAKALAAYDLVVVNPANIASCITMAVQGYAAGEYTLEDLPELIATWGEDLVDLGMELADWGN